MNVSEIRSLDYFSDRSHRIFLSLIASLYRCHLRVSGVGLSSARTAVSLRGSKLAHVRSSMTALALISTIIRGSGNCLTAIVALAGPSDRVGKTLFHSSFMPT